MKNILSIILILFLFTSCFQVKRDCLDYHTGTFKFESYINGELVTSEFIRNDTIEIEKFQGNIDTSSVRWINDCEYILRNLDPDNMAEEKAIHMKILTTNENGYTFEYGQVGDAKKSKGSVTRVSRD